MELDFAEQTLSHFDTLQTHIANNLKGLFVLTEYFSNVKKGLAEFAGSLQKSLNSVIYFLAQDKASNDSLHIALEAIVKNNQRHISLIVTACTRYQDEVIGSFNTFVNNYRKKNREIIDEGAKLISLIEREKQKVIKAQEEYLKNANAFYVSKSNGQANLVKKTMESSKVEYQSLVTFYNNFLLINTEAYIKKLQTIEQNEQVRINLISKSLEKFFTIGEQLAKNYSCTYTKIIKNLRDVNPINDVKLFTAELVRSKKISTFDRLTFEDYGEIYQYIKELNGEESPLFDEIDVQEFNSGGTLDLPDKEVKKLISKKIEEVTLRERLKKLLEGNDITDEEKLTVLSILSHKQGRHWFAEVLSTVNSKCHINNIAAFRSIGQLINNLLTITSIQETKNPFIICSVLSACCLISGSRENSAGRMRLRELVMKNNIWRIRNQWIDAIQYKIMRKLLQLNFIPTATKKQINFSSMQKKAAIFEELSLMGEQIALMGAERAMGREVLLRFAVYYEISSENTYKLLLEYEAGQILQRKTILPSKQLYTLKQKFTNKSLKKYNNTFIIAKALAYINNPYTLRNLLILNKQVNKLLNKRIYKKALILYNDNMKVRCDIWKLAILDNKLVAAYESIKENKLKKSLPNTTNIIELDIVRSFHNHSKSTQQVFVVSYNIEHN